MKLKAIAKVNLALDVIGKREDGYHELDMIMAPISLYNEIVIEPAEQSLITCDTVRLPENSTLHKTLDLVEKRWGFSTKFHVHVVKHVPDQAGLAGGSADAAALLEGLLKIHRQNKPLDQILDLAKDIGADVPFTFVHRTARVRGIGEKIDLIDTDWKLPCLLVKPDYGISTAESFKLWNDLKPVHFDLDRVSECLVHKDYSGLMESMENALEQPAFILRPELKAIKEEMEKAGLDRVMMTGSGSALMGFSQDEAVLQAACERFRNDHPFVQIIEIG